VAVHPVRPARARRRAPTLRDLVDDRVDVAIDRVTEIDTDAKELALRDGSGPLGYDHLVVATGSTLADDEIPGLEAGGHDYYSESGALDLQDELLSMTEGHLVLSVVGTPHMCPAAPLEFVFMADSWFRQRGLRDDIEITYTYPINRVHGNPTSASGRPR